MPKAMTQQGFLTQPQRTELSTFPEHINSEELIKYFCLTEKDIALIPVKSPSYSKLGFAISLCTLRLMGFIPECLEDIPQCAAGYVAKQLMITMTKGLLQSYGLRKQTKSDHKLTIENHLGFRRFNKHDQGLVTQWLLPQAMEHDRPTLLLKLVLEKLKCDKLIRPTLYSLERLVDPRPGFVQMGYLDAL